jgi:ABC-type multidrug transport system ATPase subunit
MSGFLNFVSFRFFLQSTAGKTTLLNVLAGRAQGKIQGRILLNGQPVSAAKALSKKQGYVLQDDLLMASQTPREILEFAARLRIPNSYTEEQKMQRIEDVLEELNLVNCQNTRVGAVGAKRGISGGERKRVSIGVELITNPSLIFLDEPTSGRSPFCCFSFFSIFSSKHYADFGFCCMTSQVWTAIQLTV